MSDKVVNTAEFEAYFDLVITKTISSELYTNVKKQFEDHLLDGKEYVQIINSLNANALQEARQAGAKAIQLVAEAEALDKKLAAEAEALDKKLAAEEDVTTARTELVRRQKDGFNENMIIKVAELSSNVVGMMESGGINAPAELYGEMMCAIRELAYVARVPYKDDADYPSCVIAPAPAAEE